MGLAWLVPPYGCPAWDALTLVPPKPDVLFGVSDRGTTPDFNAFAELLGKHPALLETFHPWGNSLNEAYERWRETSTRPVLHISTVDDQTLQELITPEQVLGKGGEENLPVTERDLPMKWMLVALVAFVIPLLLLYQAIVQQWSVSIPMG